MGFFNPNIFNKNIFWTTEVPEVIKKVSRGWRLRRVKQKEELDIALLVLLEELI